MKSIASIRWPIFLGVLGCAVGATAQEDEESNNRLSLGPRVSLGVKVRFSQTATPLPSALAGTLNNIGYDNGYLGVDNFNNAGGKTYNFGYNSSAQYNPAGSGSVTYNHATSPLDNSPTREAKEDFQPGVELGYERILLRIPFVGERKIKLGLGANYNWSWLDAHDNSLASGNVPIFSDTYNLSGPGSTALGGINDVVGDKSGPPNWSIQSDTTLASQTSVLGPVTASAVSRLEGNIYGVKIGPVVEIPILKRLTLSVRGGVTAVYASTKLSVTETITPIGNPLYSGSVVRHYSASSPAWLTGPFGAGQLHYDLGRGVDLFAGAEWQNLKSHTITAESRSATLDLTSALSFTVGVGYSF